LFYESSHSAFTTQQEKVLAAAAAMTGLSHVPGYYQDRLWPRIIPSTKQRHMETILEKQDYQTLAIGHSIKYCMDNPMESLLNLNILDAQIVDDDSEKEGSWELFFDAIPHSNKQLMELIPKALEGSAYRNSELDDPSCFPGSVFEWWRGQKQILFYDSPISGLQDLGFKMSLWFSTNVCKQHPTFANNSTERLFVRLFKDL
jgi:hypothetical protein